MQAFRTVRYTGGWRDCMITLNPRCPDDPSGTLRVWTHSRTNRCHRLGQSRGLGRFLRTAIRPDVSRSPSCFGTRRSMVPGCRAGRDGQGCTIHATHRRRGCALRLASTRRSLLCLRPIQTGQSSYATRTTIDDERVAIPIRARRSRNPRANGVVARTVDTGLESRRTTHSPSVSNGMDTQTHRSIGRTQSRRSRWSNQPLRRRASRTSKGTVQ